MTSLTDALTQLTDRGQRPPCGDGTDRWLSDLPTERAQAVELCAGCPILPACQDAAAEHNPTFGVWAGVDLTRPETRSTRRKRNRL